MTTTPNTPGETSTAAPATLSEEATPGRWWRPAWLNRNLLLLFGGRGLRSFAQAYLVIIVPLYMASLGYDAIHLGILFTAAAITSAVLAAFIGFFSDRFGRKTALIGISLMMAGGGIAFALTSNFLALVLAGALGTIGRGGGAGSAGAFGPYYPAEQALIAEHTSDRQRTTIFGALSFVGVIMGAIGSLLAALPALLHLYGVSAVASYRVLFIFTAVVGIALVAITIPIRDQVRAAHRQSHVAPGAAGETRAGQASTRSEPAGKNLLGLSSRSWNVIGRFMITNTTNGLAIGVLGAFVVYWFYRRYGIDSSALAGLFFAVNLASALPYLFAGRLASRLGAVNTVVFTRVVSVVLLFVMVAMPTFLLASVVFLARMIANTLSNPVRQSYLMGVIPPFERSRAAGLANLPMQAAASASPYMAGYLIQLVSLNLPLELAAAMQGINAILYYIFFRNIRPPEEQERINKEDKGD